LPIPSPGEVNGSTRPLWLGRCIGALAYAPTIPAVQVSCGGDRSTVQECHGAPEFLIGCGRRLVDAAPSVTLRTDSTRLSSAMLELGGSDPDQREPGSASSFRWWGDVRFVSSNEPLSCVETPCFERPSAKGRPSIVHQVLYSIKGIRMMDPGLRRDPSDADPAGPMN
jgi:hypothetical protein